MKKRVLCFLLVLCMVAAILPTVAMAAGNGTLDNPWTSGSVNVYKDGSTLHVFGNGAMTDYANKSDAPWYSVSGDITRIVIESGVTKLGNNAFAACGSVSTIALKRDLTISGALNMVDSSLPTGASVELEICGDTYMADYDSNQPWANLKTNLVKVVLDEGVKSIGAQAFSGCVKLQSVVIPGTVEYIGAQAFANCLALTDVKLVHDFTCNANSGKPFTIGNGAFPVSNSGFNIALEISGTTAVPDYVNADAQPWANYRAYITDLVIGGDVPGIGNNAFHSCNQIKNVTMYFNEVSEHAQKTMGIDVFKFHGNMNINVKAVSEDLAFKTWGGATFASATSENTVTYYNANGCVITAEWNPVTRGISVNPTEDKNYGDVELGYSALEAYTVVVKNTGNAASGQLHVELSGGYPNAFVLSTTTIPSLNPKGVANITVTPALGKGNGSYYTDVRISDEEATIAQFRVSFTVGTATTRATRFVKRLYTQALGRAESAISEEELSNWVNALVTGKMTGADVATAFFTSDEFRALGLSNADFVTTLYKSLLDRVPVAAEIQNWVNALNAGKTRAWVYAQFIASAEYKNVATRDSVQPGAVDYTKIDISNKIAATTAAKGFVTRLYSVVLGRTPDEEGLNNWSVALTNGNLTASQVAAGFFGSQEYVNQNKSNRDFVIDLYKTMLDRTYDEPGLQNWLNYLKSGKSRPETFNGFIGSVEFNKLCATYGFSTGTAVDPKQYNMGANTDSGNTASKMSEADATAALKSLYLAVFNREPDTGADTWKTALMNGTVSHAQLTANLMSSQEYLNTKSTNEQFVQTVYQALLGRSASATEQANWVATIAGGTTRATAFSQICASEEYKNVCSSKGYSWANIDPAKSAMGDLPKTVMTDAVAEAYVNLCYSEILGATPDAAGLAMWKEQLLTGKMTAAQVAAGIFGSEQFRARALSNEQFVAIAYRVLLGRDASATEIAGWVKNLTSGATRAKVLSDIVKCAEYSNHCKAAGYAAGTINPASYSIG